MYIHTVKCRHVLEQGDIIEELSGSTHLEVRGSVQSVTSCGQKNSKAPKGGKRKGVTKEKVLKKFIGWMELDRA